MKEFKEECMTIVVPVYNRPELLLRCLESIKAQTWRPLKVIVVDNGSTDNTKSVAERWAKENATDDFDVEVLEDLRRGAAYARQTGLEHTDTDKVMFFDSDDASRPQCVEIAMEAWKRQPDVDIMAWPIVKHLPDGLHQTHPIKGNLLEKHLVHCILQTQCFAVKTDCIRAAGGWNGEIPTWNDYETVSRILLLNPKVLAFTKPQADIYPQKESITGTSFSAKAGVWEKALNEVTNSIFDSYRDDSVRLLNIVSYRRAILAANYAKEGRMDLATPLYSQALREMSMLKKPLIMFAYHWTRLGKRGAFSIVGPML